MVTLIEVFNATDYLNWFDLDDVCKELNKDEGLEAFPEYGVNEEVIGSYLGILVDNYYVYKKKINGKLNYKKAGGSWEMRILRLEKDLFSEDGSPKFIENDGYYRCL